MTALASHSEKPCFKCGDVKPVEEFYRHPQMSDGRVNKCKQCYRMDVSSNRSLRISYYRKYDVERSRSPKRMASIAEVARKWRNSNPRKWKAQCALNNAIRKRKVVRKPCERCGSIRSHGHHENYDKPLEVVWLCAIDHKLRHKEMKAQGIIP